MRNLVKYVIAGAAGLGLLAVAEEARGNYRPHYLEIVERRDERGIKRYEIQPERSVSKRHKSLDSKEVKDVLPDPFEKGTEIKVPRLILSDEEFFLEIE